MDEKIEELCVRMHDAYEDAAKKEGWETQERSRKPWADVPEANKRTMRAAVSAACLPLLDQIDRLAMEAGDCEAVRREWTEHYKSAIGLARREGERAKRAEEARDEAEADRERAEERRSAAEHQRDLTEEDRDDAHYRGYRMGIEAAAKVCDEHTFGEDYFNVAHAKRIRALLDEVKGSVEP
jgi:hypothetical protein